MSILGKTSHTGSRSDIGKTIAIQGNRSDIAKTIEHRESNQRLREVRSHDILALSFGVVKVSTGAVNPEKLSVR